MEKQWSLNYEAKQGILKDRILKLAKNEYEVELNLQFATSQNQQESIDKLTNVLDGIRAAMAFHLAELQKLNDEQKQTLENSDIHDSAE